MVSIGVLNVLLVFKKQILEKILFHLPPLLLLFSSVVSDSLRPHGLQHARLPCPLLSLSLLKLMSMELVMPSNQLILYHPLLLLPSIFPSIRVFFNELALCIRWPKYWSFNISPSNEYSGWISFRIDWFHLPHCSQVHLSRARVLT